MSKKLLRNEDVKHLGIGIDTARYGHCAAFLRDDKNPAANLLEFRESGDGYRKFQRRIEQLHVRYPEAQIHVRIDAAGQYSANLERFVRSIREPQLCVSVGEPKRNMVYLWPDAAAKKKQPPLVLRLIVTHDGKHPVYLVTNLTKSQLSDGQAGMIYGARWGIELFFRTFKQTFGRRKLRSRSAENADLELDWSGSITFNGS